MRNIFLSFLGTGNYTPCNYIFKDCKVEAVCFVQEAMARFFCAGFKADDRIFIFLTDAARDSNWIDTKDKAGNPREGLKSRLQALNLNPAIRDIDIPEGNSEDEIWQIFSTAYDAFNEEDNVILDITHGFRSLPMLGMVLLNYVRFLKNIRIEGIYYGAFETLGSPYRVKEMPLEERNAPIFDLTSFDHLLQWSQGAENFVNYGNPNKITELVNATVLPTLIKTHGRDRQADLLRNTAKLLDKLSGQLTTNRGLDLVAGETAIRLKKNIGSIRTEGLPVLEPLLDPMKRKIEHFKKDCPKNCLVAAKWCLDHDLVQQGITILQEGIITIILEKLDEDWRDRLSREVVSGCFNVCNRRIKQENWNEKLKRKDNLTRKLLAVPLLCKLAPIYDKLSKYRNDINHAGFIKPRQSESFRRKLRESLACIEEIVAIDQDPTGFLKGCAQDENLVETLLKERREDKELEH